MKKPAIIIGKKQIIMACLTMILAIAVYVNYVIAGGAKVKKEAMDNPAHSDEYGDTKFVNAGDGDIQDMNAADYFAQARIDKAASRDQAVQTLQSIIGGGDVTNDEAVVNALEAVKLSQMTELENKLESLIKGLGYTECIVYLDDNNAKVVLQTTGLDTAQAAAIKDLILSETSVTAQDIRIFEVKA